MVFCLADFYLDSFRNDDGAMMEDFWYGEMFLIWVLLKLLGD
jgi:hypothetical protein